MSALGITISALLGNSGVAAAVATRVFPIIAPQRAAMPYVIVTLISEADEQMLAGAGGYFDSRVEVQCVAGSATEANQIGEAVKSALQNLTNASIGEAEATVMKVGDDYFDYSDDRSAFRRFIDFSVRWRG